MPAVSRPYDLVTDIRTRAERLRQTELENTVLGLIRADRIEVTSLSVISENAGTITAGTLIGTTIETGTTRPFTKFTPTGIEIAGTTGRPDIDSPSSIRWTNSPDDGVGALTHAYTGASGSDTVSFVEIWGFYGGGNADAEVGLWTGARDFSITGHPPLDASAFSLPGFLTVDGNGLVSMSSNPAVISDERVKREIADLEGSLDTVRKLRSRTFKSGRAGGHGHGFIAQEVEEVLPDAIREQVIRTGTGEKMGSEVIKGVIYDHILTCAVGAIQELADRLDKLEGHA